MPHILQVKVQTLNVSFLAIHDMTTFSPLNLPPLFQFISPISSSVISSIDLILVYYVE